MLHLRMEYGSYDFFFLIFCFGCLGCGGHSGMKLIYSTSYTLLS